MSKDTDFDSNKKVDSPLESDNPLTENERLERIESVIVNNRPSLAISSSDSDEIDLNELVSVLWLKKLTITLTTISFLIVAVLYALSLPNTYKATTVLAPTSQEKESALSGLASQYGGLAAMAGINLGGASGENKVDHALKLLRSWPYIESFVQKFNLKPVFLATEGWDKTTNSLVYDGKLYDSKSGTWLLDKNASLEPSSYETYETVIKNISIGIEKETGLINLSVSHYSPYVAKDVVTLLTTELNDYFKKIDQVEAEKSIDVLSKKIMQTHNNDMKQIFYKMIEQHSKTLLMTEVNEQYLIKTLVPVMLPERKSGPKRSIICILGALIGFFLSILVILTRYYMKYKRVKEK